MKYLIRPNNPFSKADCEEDKTDKKMPGFDNLLKTIF